MVFNPFTIVVAKKLGCQLKIKLRQLKEGAKRLMLSGECVHCPLPSDRQPKIQLAICHLFSQGISLGAGT